MKSSLARARTLSLISVVFRRFNAPAAASLRLFVHFTPRSASPRPLFAPASVWLSESDRPGSVTEPLTGDMQTDRQQTDERRERAAGNSWKHLLLHRKERCIGVGSTGRAQGGRENLLRMDVKVPRRTATRFSRGRASVCVYIHRYVCVCVCLRLCASTFTCINTYTHT